MLASLEYSLRRLTDEQRALLPRLALFEGGALESQILAITEIPENEWAALRSALEQAALIRAEYIHEAINVPYLRFHPVLAPFLRTQPGADDIVLKQRYVTRYYSLANYLYQEDTRNPQTVRALVRRELPNLRRALALLIEMDELDAAVVMFNSMARFLNNFGMWRERDELSKQVDAVLAQRKRSSNELTRAEYLRESERGEAEFSSGNIQAAFNRFTKLLERIEAQPEGAKVGRGSYNHCLTLGRVARCLRFGGHSTAAEIQLNEALGVIDELIKQQPDQQVYIRQRAALLPDLGDVLMEQGKYQAARAAYEESVRTSKQIGDIRNAGVGLTQLGTLALKQKNYDEATTRYQAALHIDRILNEPERESIDLHQLGRVAEEQQQWSEAECYYRESLTIRERHGYQALAATTCNQLAIVAANSGRPTEAENWYKRALALGRATGNDKAIATRLNNLAHLLLDEVRAGHAPQSRLAEARSYADQALKILETFDASSQPWINLNTLASIAELEGRDEEARAYRRRERETFAAFAGNRYHIDRQHAQLIVAIAVAAQGHEQARAMVEDALPNLEEHGWKITDATRRIWASERDWYALTEGLDSQDALLIKRVLETIENPEAAPEIERQGPDMAAMLQQLEPLLQDIAAVAQRDETQRAAIETWLADAETKGWRLTNHVQRIWAGERDAAKLCEGVNELDAVIVRRILEIMAGAGG